MDEQSALASEVEKLKKEVEAIKKSIVELEKGKSGGEAAPAQVDAKSSGQGKAGQTPDDANSQSTIERFQPTALRISIAILVVILLLIILLSLLSFDQKILPANWSEQITRLMGESRLLEPPWTSPAREQSAAVRYDAWAPTPTPMATPVPILPKGVKAQPEFQGNARLSDAIVDSLIPLANLPAVPILGQASSQRPRTSRSCSSGSLGRLCRGCVPVCSIFGLHPVFKVFKGAS